MSFHDAFEASVTFDPVGDAQAFYLSVPARWVVYLMADADDRPIQLLCVRNLRSSLRRRLGQEAAVAEQPGGLSRRIDYRQIVRRIHWRRVDSTFEADWRYFEAARRVFPQTYRGMVGFRPAWFIHVNPETAFPRFIKTIDLSSRTGILIGPVEDKHAAARLIELAVDCFDLCRYYSILVQAPHGRACAYKEMGKCPAPCDGSISMDQYRRLLAMGIEAIIDPTSLIHEHTQRMSLAAAEMQFESASKIKAFVAQLQMFAAGPFRHARYLSDFKYLSVQRGPRSGTAKLFLITPGAIEPIACLTGLPTDSELIGHVLNRGAQADLVADADLLGVVTHHLFAPQKAAGVLLPMDALDHSSLANAYRQSIKQVSKDDEAAAAEATGEEGLMKEMQSL